jgi:hypothetical protein
MAALSEIMNFKEVNHLLNFLLFKNLVALFYLKYSFCCLLDSIARVDRTTPSAHVTMRKYGWFLYTRRIRKVKMYNIFNLQKRHCE